MKNLKWLSIPIAVMLIASILVGLFYWNTPRVEATQGVLSLSVGLNNDKQPPPADISKFDPSNKIKTVKGDNLDEVDISDLSWINSGDKVGLKITPPSLPSYVKVLGTPLPTSNQSITLNPQDGRMAWYLNDNKASLIQWYPRVILNSLPFQITSVSKTGKFATSDNNTIFGWNGQVVTPSGSLDYSISQWAAPNRDDFGIQLSFTSPINLPAFSYELAFSTSIGIDGFRMLQGKGIKSIDYPIKQTAQADFPSDVQPTVSFLSGSNRVASYSFRDLYEKALSSYWRIDADLSIVIGFRFAGLTAGQKFNNDGYFGYQTPSGTYDMSTSFLAGSYLQNTVGAGTLTTICIYFNDASPTGNCAVALYSDVSGTPTTLLLDGGTKAVANGWVNQTGLSYAVTLNTWYWLACQISATNTINIQSAASNTGAYRSSGVTYPTFPTPFTPASYDNEPLCLRAYVVTAAPATLEQEGYCWRNDDGSETTATWMAAQDANVTAPSNTNTRLRVILNSTGDYASSAFQLEYSHNSSTPFRQVQTTHPAISFGVASATTLTAAAGRTDNGTYTVTIPTSWAAGQCAIMLAYNDQGTGAVTTPATGWTQLTGSPWGTTTTIQAWSRILQSGDVDPIITITGSTTGMSHCAAIATYNNVNPTTPVEVIGTANQSTGTPMTAASIDTLTDGAWVLGLCGRGDNEVAGSQTFGVTNATERFDSGTNAGNDSEVSLADLAIASHGACGRASSTTSATDPWISVIIALKPYLQPVLMSLSGNIAASASTNTTAQLTAPSGKGGFFTAGRISDDTNPITVDITSGNYTEIEYCLSANSSIIANGDILTFRVTVSGTAIDTYTVTPTWTIGTAGLSISNTPTSKDFGAVFPDGRIVYAKGTAPNNPCQDGDCTYTMQNNGSVTENVTIQSSNWASIGTTWSWVSGSPGLDQARGTFYGTGDNVTNGVIISASPQAFHQNLAPGVTWKWDFKLEMPTSSTNTNSKSCNITLTVSVP